MVEAHPLRWGLGTQCSVYSRGRCRTVHYRCPGILAGFGSEVHQGWEVARTRHEEGSEFELSDDGVPWGVRPLGEDEHHSCSFRAEFSEDSGDE